MSGSAGAKWAFSHRFCADFNSSVSELASRLDALKSNSDVPPATMQDITSDLSRLTKMLGDATGSLPSYDQRQCELQLKALEKCTEDLRRASTTASKFSFKRKGTKPKSSTEHAPAAVPPPSGSQLIKVDSSRHLVAFSHRYLTISDVRSPNPSAEVSISDLDNCIVNLLSGDEDHSTMIALHVQHVSRCIVLLPRVSGSIILHDLSECVVVVGCHQFRMHDSMAVDVYLDSGSDPIIEHCSNIRFATYPSSLVHEGTLQDCEHFTVKDFSHILPTPSPNWSFLLEEERERSWPVSVLQDQALQEELERMLSAHPRPLKNGLQT